MSVLRIQNRNGKSPYIDSPTELYYQINTEFEHRPSPMDDIGIERWPKIDKRCGFLNQDQLDRWFDNFDLEILESYDYYITEVNGTITAIGEYQVLYIVNDNPYWRQENENRT